MEWSGLFHLIQSWGPSAVSSVLIYVVIHLIKKIDVNSQKDEKRAADLREYINKTLNTFGDRLTTVEKDYVKNDFFFRELSGWKSEINRLSDQITNQFMVFTQNILNLFNRDKQ
ncbi:MAG: hypothetical protein LBU85_13200 [Treponema sp.]|jgi:hypothetical protein|nr:hypothetical protein [Treponema sp.]